MRDYIGKTIRDLRIGKGMTLRELSSNLMSTSQLSNIESGSQIPSTEKFLILLNRLNVKYDEFILLMENDYLKKKTLIERELAEAVKLKNLKKLRDLSFKAKNLNEKYRDIYFYHVELISLSVLHLLKNNNDYTGARIYLDPIKEYLIQIEEWTYYELALICNCIFMFDIESAVLLGERALTFIEKKYCFYRNEEISCVLLNNLATYSLDFETYYPLALKYSQVSSNLSSTNNLSSSSIRAKIIYQIACYKLQNGQYQPGYLESLINIFKLLGWNDEYYSICKFVNKHGISIKK
ncbi:helix-turn-helix domain-containing protein [Enterococcus casseliflavus]|uniref:helix-turn-helix domain-containing protein n=1 Tax=Enterococcus casseliflavus TaxID=37734 RepID=UPI0020BE1779|nr:Rgg/GadR/MutR family transcriptional regulator [Enterococcus casseliflavus]